MYLRRALIRVGIAARGGTRRRCPQAALPIDYQRPKEQRTAYNWTAASAAFKIHFGDRYPN
jgi:hypothetical protein